MSEKSYQWVVNQINLKWQLPCWESSMRSSHAVWEDSSFPSVLEISEEIWPKGSVLNMCPIRMWGMYQYFNFLDKETEVQVCKMQCQKFPNVPSGGCWLHFPCDWCQPLCSTVLSADLNHIFLPISTLPSVVFKLSVLLYPSVAATLWWTLWLLPKSSSGMKDLNFQLLVPQISGLSRYCVGWRSASHKLMSTSCNQ